MLNKKVNYQLYKHKSNPQLQPQYSRSTTTGNEVWKELTVNTELTILQ